MNDTTTQKVLKTSPIAVAMYVVCTLRLHIIYTVSRYYILQGGGGKEGLLTEGIHSLHRNRLRHRSPAALRSRGSCCGCGS